MIFNAISRWLKNSSAKQPNQVNSTIQEIINISADNTYLCNEYGHKINLFNKSNSKFFGKRLVSTILLCDRCQKEKSIFLNG